MTAQEGAEQSKSQPKVNTAGGVTLVNSTADRWGKTGNGGG